MKLKLDENLGPAVAAVFTAAGTDVDTVRDEGLGGATDERVAAAALSAAHALVTLDQGFGNVLRFPPEQTPGIAVLKPPGRHSPAMLQRLATVLAAALRARTIAGRLWIVEPGRIREHGARDLDTDGAEWVDA